MHYQWRFSFVLCSHMIINYSSLFMSMSNFILININIMDMKRHMLICFFISILVGKESGKIVIKIKTSYLKRNEVAFQQLFFHVPSLTDKTHILSLIHVVFFIFNHFFQLAFVGLSIQLHKYLTWAPFGLSLKFILIEFYCPLMALRSLMSPLALPLLPFLFCRKLQA